MSRTTVDQLQSRIAAYVDQDEDTANIDTADYSLRLSYLNRAQEEWAEIYPWQVLYSVYNTIASTSTGNASVVLPSDFRKLWSYPLITYDGTTTSKFSEVLPQDDNQYGENDKRVWILGSPQGGYILRVKGATMTSGASITVPYIRSAISLATSTTIPDIPNPEYLVQRTISFILESREDARFPQAKADAERILSNMIEYENVFNRASDYDRIKTVEETKFNFKIGRD